MLNVLAVRLVAVLVTLGAVVAAAPSASAAQRTDRTTVSTSTSTSSIGFGVTTPGGFGAAAELTQVTQVAGAAPNVVMAYSDFAQALDVAGLDAVAARGATPMITWEPWRWGDGLDQPAYSLANITAGAYDGYLKNWARGLRSWGKPVYLRFAHEMNGDWYPWSERVNGNRPGDYVAAWRHVRSVFDAQKVTNVRWVWSPNASYDGSIDLASLYPGSRYVDVLAVDGYNWGSSTSWSTWTSPAELFDPTLAQLRAIAPGMPIAIGETSSAEQGGSKAAWVTDFFAWLGAQPDVAFFVWFDHAKETDWRIDSSESSAAAFTTGLATLRP